MASFRVSFSPPTVGAYRIRPDVSEQEMMAASKLSLKPCRKTQQGFHARKSVAAQRGKVFPPGKVFLRSAASFSRLGKCSCAARQGFPARENVPRKPSKVFPPGEMSLGNRARFSRINSILNSSLVCHFRRREGRMRYAPTHLPLICWGCGDGWCRFIFCFSP